MPTMTATTDDEARPKQKEAPREVRMREDSGGTNLRSEDLMCQSAFGQREPQKDLAAQPGRTEVLSTRSFANVEEHAWGVGSP